MLQHLFNNFPNQRNVTRSLLSARHSKRCKPQYQHKNSASSSLRAFWGPWWPPMAPDGQDGPTAWASDHQWHGRLEPWAGITWDHSLFWGDLKCQTLIARTKISLQFLLWAGKELRQKFNIWKMEGGVILDATRNTFPNRATKKSR